MELTFEMSEPFLPYEQLLSVLPAASKALLPPTLQGLMEEDWSPILDYYPPGTKYSLRLVQRNQSVVAKFFGILVDSVFGPDSFQAVNESQPSPGPTQQYLLLILASS